MPDRPADQPDLNPGRIAADPLLAEIASMVAYMDLHIGKHQIKQMTTRQKEMWADLVDAHNVLDPADPDDIGFTARWWREDWDGPTGPEDPRWHDATLREPDPFIYDQQRTPETIRAQTDVPHDGAVAVARHALLDVTSNPQHPERPWLAEDLVAVYEFAKRAATSSRNSLDEIVSGTTVYPAPITATAFLAEHRAARHRRLGITGD